jgi:hypothetical protein
LSRTYFETSLWGGCGGAQRRHGGHCRGFADSAPATQRERRQATRPT